MLSSESTSDKLAERRGAKSSASNMIDGQQARERFQ